MNATVIYENVMCLERPGRNLHTEVGGGVVLMVAEVSLLLCEGFRSLNVPGSLINHLFSRPFCIPVGLQVFIFLFVASTRQQKAVFCQCL